MPSWHYLYLLGFQIEYHVTVLWTFILSTAFLLRLHHLFWLLFQRPPLVSRANVYLTANSAQYLNCTRAHRTELQQKINKHWEVHADKW